MRMQPGADVVILSGSSLRRNVCEQLFAIPPTLTAKPAPLPVSRDQADAIAGWLSLDPPMSRGVVRAS